MYVIEALLCVDTACGWFIRDAEFLGRNNKRCRLIATVPATEQKRFLQKYAANDWVSPSLSVFVATTKEQRDAQMAKVVSRLIRVVTVLTLNL